MKDKKKSPEMVHYLDMDEFSKASEEERREMVRQMLMAIRRKKDGEDEEGR
jgi:hypothetical protein